MAGSGVMRLALSKVQKTAGKDANKRLAGEYKKQAKKK